MNHFTLAFGTYPCALLVQLRFLVVLSQQLNQQAYLIYPSNSYQP